jgi:hypothetical protein
MKKDISKYIRVGIEYYKEVIVPMTREDIKVLRRWNKQTILDDFNKEELKKIERFDGFCFIPSHENFQKIINGFYNRYEPISYHLNSQGTWDQIEILLRHIFGNQYDLGLDYLTLLWQKPTQALPIFCLVSDERNTGKTTFLNLMKAIFEGNMTLNTNEDFRSRFNSDWTGKLIVAIDEVLLDKRDDSERIKNLSTAKYYKAESKGKDKEEVEFFGKFILCSNNEDSFVKIDSKEIRYWVRKIPTLGNSVNPNMLDKLIKEVPAFAYFLNTREVVTEKATRMWFTKEQIHTEALDVLISGNRTSIEKELEEMLKDEFAVFEVDKLCYSLKNIVEMLRGRGVSTSSNYIATILKNKYNLENEKNSSYKWYRSEIYNTEATLSNGFTSEKGRYYSFERSIFTN